MSNVDVISEEECQRGWTYRVRVEGHDGAASEHSVRLDWAEHELWCGGRCPPSRVVEVLLRFIFEQDPARILPEKFDAATVRRWLSDVDEAIVKRL